MNELLAQAAALRDLVGASPGGTVPRDVSDAILRCCNALLDAGRAEGAIELAKSLDGRTGDRASLAAVEARVRNSIGEHREALRIARAGLRDEGLGSLTPEALVDLRLAEASSLTHLNQADDALKLLRRLRSELLSRPDSQHLARCAMEMMTANMLVGDSDAARRDGLEALVSARRSACAFIEAHTLLNLSRLEKALCRWPAALEMCEQARDIFAALGNRKETNNARRAACIVAWKRGALETARRHADAVVEDASTIRTSRPRMFGELLVGMIEVHAGNYETARDSFLSARPASESDHSRPSLLTTEFLGDIHLEQGEADEAQKFYDEVWPKALALVPKGDIVAELRRRRAEVAYLQERYEDAYAEAMGGLEHCRELGDRYEEAATYRVLALAAAALGRHDEARRWFDQGFAYYDDIETPYEWGKLWLSYGDWLRGAHAGSYADRVGALEAYHAARDHFERMGARAKLEMANHRIAEMIAEDAESDRIDSALAAEEADAPRHARRRPAGSAEIDRRSDWARQTFGIVTRSKQVLHMLEDVAKLAASRTPILVLGESGTGKELVAGGVHALSGRTGAFVPVNCGALPREIIESELFGHTAGSFTGAVRDKAGLVEVCDGGTIFLDEIAEMTLESQSRVLRFLETGESRRVGSTRNVAVDTRIVAATNRDRHSLEQGDGFRPDLYYRLAHAVVTLPPLRRRGEDVELLIDHFLAEVCAEERRDVTLSARALKRLRKYPWPGNVRQLRSVIRRTVLLATPGTPVDETLLQLDDGTRAPGNLLEEMEHAEKQRLRDALSAARGSRTDAARALGIPRTTFINKMKRFGIV